MKNSQFDVKDVREVGEKKLGIKFKSAKEYNGWFWLNGRKAKRLTVPKGRKGIPPGTYSSMAKQLGLTVSQFDSLLECPLSKEIYEKIISQG